MAHIFTREQLYGLVWADPMQKVAARLGLSDVGLAKACRAAAVPVPERGYWAKLQAGKKVERPGLPIRPLGMLDEVQIGPNAPWKPFAEEEPSSEPPVPPSFAEPIPEMVERVRKMVGKVPPAKNLDGPHPAIAKLLQDDERRRQKQLASPYPFMWESPAFESPFELRRLRILSALFTALERCGARPSARGREGREVSVSVGSVHIDCKLDSPDRRGPQERNLVQKPDPNRPKGPLRFEITEWKKPNDGMKWDDTNEVKLEGLLAEIAVQILVMGESVLREWVQERYEDEIERRAELKEKVRLKKEADEQMERERIAKLERERVEQLVRDANSWRQATELRAYVKAVTDAKASEQGGEAHGTLIEWAGWALSVADKLDPLLRSRFEVSGGE